jgi:hypothetical protein
MKLTRRQILATAALAPAAVEAQAPAATADDELRAARERLKTTAAALAPVNLPMSTEPAFQFEA